MNDVDSKNDEIEISVFIVISLAKLIFPEIQTFYNSTEGKEYFAKWDLNHKNNKVKP